MFKFDNIPTDQIKVIDRARKDFGDIDKLAQSISSNGLIYPIVVNAQFELLAGERRLRAVKQLNWDTIDVKIIEANTAEDNLIIELIDNTDRKDFTWDEEITLKRKIHDQFVTQNDKWGYRDTAKKLNCSLGGLSTDLELAKIIEQIPTLKELPTKAKARDTYKKMHAQAVAITAVESMSVEDKQRLHSMFKDQPTMFGVNETPVLTGQTAPKNGVNVNPGTVAPVNVLTSRNANLEVQVKSELPAYVYKISTFREFIRELPNNFIGFAELDPPYAINFNETYGKTTKIKSTEQDWTYDKLKVEMEWLFRKLYLKLIDNSWLLCWTGKEHWLLMNSLAEKAGFSTQEPGVWVKPSGSSNSPKTNMISQYEMFVLMRKGQAQFNINSFPNVITHATINHNQKGHQWEKPIELYSKFMEACGKKESTFLSPFAGSGTSMVAAQLFGMTPMGCDINQKYIYRFLELFKDRCSKINGDKK